LKGVDIVDTKEREREPSFTREAGIQKQYKLPYLEMLVNGTT
jgi:hypothetical protein